jgi:hypothetical protein
MKLRNKPFAPKPGSNFRASGGGEKAKLRHKDQKLLRPIRKAAFANEGGYPKKRVQERT